MVPSHRELGFAEVAALFPGDRIFEEFRHATFGVIWDKATAGRTPAAPATLVQREEGREQAGGWGSLFWVVGCDSGGCPPACRWAVGLNRLRR